jgi:flagellar biosynthetic protein FliR
MPNLLQFDPNLFIGFVVIFARVTGVIVAAPIFGETTVPPQVKAGLALLISLVFYPIVTAPRIGPDPSVFQLVHLVTVETGVGLLLGFSARLLMAGIELAGEVAGFQMGLGLANVVDPMSGTQIGLLGQMMSLFATLVLVMMDGHHLFIAAVASSYAVVGPGQATLGDPALDSMMMLAAQLFVIGLKVGAPLVVALLAANFAMGLMARSVPQMNVFVVGFPFTIGLGLLFLVIGFPFFIQAVSAVLGDLEMVLMNQVRSVR